MPENTYEILYIHKITPTQFPIMEKMSAKVDNNAQFLNVCIEYAIRFSFFLFKLRANAK